ncbi:MAG: helix-turn-helix domain-containing protein, partial [Bacilli bacterium]|nr:helix-turn-helix domain-containing protein [Bacilli bacterium]
MLKLQEKRKKCGLTQQEIAKKLGISQQAYGNYERDALSIPAKMMDKISKILMIDPSQLVYEPDLENDSITEFLHKSLTAYHAVYNAISLLEKEGFKELKESESWNIKVGGKYFVTKNRSALIAFIVGDLSHYAFNISSCHTDSPSLKIKGNSLLDSVEGKRINVEKYGGLINYTFLDIP